MHRVGRDQRGIALLMVLSMLALVGGVVAEFQFQSHVDLALAFNARDDLQAEMNALSALRMRALILKQSRKVQALVNSLMALTGGAGAQGGVPTLPVGAILDMIPVECGLMSAITRASDVAEGREEDFFPGDCQATSESEHAKISINLLRQPVNNQAAQVAQMLLAMLSLPQMQRYFEQDDRNGIHAQTPLELVTAITDWIDADHTEGGNLGDEDRHYQYLKRPYRAKNAPFDSIAELQMVYGVNDALYHLLRDQLTIYKNDLGIELQTAPVDRIVWGLFASLLPSVPPQAFLVAVPQLASTLTTMKALGGGFSALNRAALTLALTQLGVAQLFDPTLLSQRFTDGTSTTWYTLNAQGRVGNASRHIRAVFQATEGLFYYVRVD